MGAGIETTEGRLPMGIQGRTLRAIDYAAPGGERAGEVRDPACGPLRRRRDDGRRAGTDPRPHRADARRGRRARDRQADERDRSRRAERLSLDEIEVPGDFSSAAPFVVAATLVPGSEIHVHGVNLNPRRTGLLEILDRMGARITSYNRRLIGGEPAGDLEIHAAPLVGTTVEAQEVPLAIDELPLVALAAACARGETVIRGAAELRAKETDRIEATVDALRALGVRARGLEDGLSVLGVPARPRGGRMESRGDHRLAMLGAVAGLASREGVRIDDSDAVTVSFPGLLRDARRASPALGRGRGRPKITSAR